MSATKRASSDVDGAPPAKRAKKERRFTVIRTVFKLFEAGDRDGVVPYLVPDMLDVPDTKAGKKAYGAHLVAHANAWEAMGIPEGGEATVYKSVHDLLGSEYLVPNSVYVCDDGSTLANRWKFGFR